MSYKKLYILLIAFLHLKSLHAGHMEGEIISSIEQKMFISRLFFDDKIDTLILSKGFNRKILNYHTDKPEMFFIRFEKAGADIFLILAGEDVVFTTDLTRDTTLRESANHILIKGSVTSQKYYDCSRYLYLIKTIAMGFKEEQDFLNPKKDSIRITSFIRQVKNLEELRINYIIVMIKQSDNPVISYWGMKTLTTLEAVPDSTLEELYNTSITRFDPVYFLDIRQNIENFTKAQDNIKVDSTFIEFEMPDTAGIIQRISKFKGKFVLIDFWASWCVPCRSENPNIKYAYELYKSRNFEIIGVSLDSKREEWLNAIHKDQINKWMNISELKNNSSVIKKYNISTIPFNVLINPKLKVIAKNLRGEELIKKLALYLPDKNP